MVFFKERDHEQALLSLILPHLYLGAETDVTQECLSSREISYVLSVSRCSPQPTFLPCSHYLRIPIDDSLRDDLLAWIPEALKFIDGAINSGNSILVHCAAGISRSPALAVAYIMYHLGMDLDHAYRFVKERRPTISPNFNFLGQLQHFQGTLIQKTPSGNNIVLPVKHLDTCPKPTTKNYNSPIPPSASQSFQNNHVIKGCTDLERVNTEHSYYAVEEEEQRAHSCTAPNWPETAQKKQCHLAHPTLSLSSHLRTLALTHNQNQTNVQTTCKDSTPVLFAPAHPMPMSNQLQITSSFTSLSEKRKSLTLSLFPVTAAYPTSNQRLPKSSINCNDQARKTNTTSMIHSRETVTLGGVKSHHNLPAAHLDLETRKAKSRNQAKSRIDGRVQGNQAFGCGYRGEEEPCKVQKQGRDYIIGKALDKYSAVKSQHNVVATHQVTPETKRSTTGIEAEENYREHETLLSPVNLTVHKLLDWGERILLGLFLAPRIKMGQTALPH